MASDFWKTQTYWSLPVYTGDVSGVCSALYELGGMVVMHDPSGCNSTYNTHDEIRWMSMESLIFLSGLTQLDAITGNDQKLVEDIASAAGEFGPAFIAIANSPVPWLIATDFGAVCRKVKELTFISTFHVETNAMHDYTSGAGKAFLALAKMLFGEETGRNSAEYHRFEADGHDCADEKIRVNILGLTPLDFTIRSDIGMLRGLLEAEGRILVDGVPVERKTLPEVRRKLVGDGRDSGEAEGCPERGCEPCCLFHRHRHGKVDGREFPYPVHGRSSCRLIFLCALFQASLLCQGKNKLRGISRGSGYRRRRAGFRNTLQKMHGR